MQIGEAIRELRALANPANVAGMTRFGINPKGTLGISIPVLRRLARQAGRDHALALALWKTGIHEARILAALVDEPALVTPQQMDRWAADFDSWDVCDGCCSNLFDRTPHAYGKCFEWSSRPEEYVKRAAFALMAALAVHDKQAPDSRFLQFLPVIAREANDDRNFVRKAVNWALRQIGKRNPALRQAAMRCAENLRQMDSRAARWIAADARRELRAFKGRPATKRREPSREKAR
jgi:3-methyladenine DNA glycosylase AlkD